MTNRRYMTAFVLAMAGYTLTLFGSIWAIENGELSGWSAGLASLTPLIPAFFALQVFIARFKSMDEFQRRIMSEAILWGAGIVGFACFGYGFLEGAVDVPDIGLIWVFPALIGVYGLVQCFLFWQANR